MVHYDSSSVLKSVFFSGACGGGGGDSEGRLKVTHFINGENEPQIMETRYAAIRASILIIFQTPAWVGT